MSKRFKKKLLFTPGPLNTSDLTKKTTFIDLGSRDKDFIRINKLLFSNRRKMINKSFNKLFKQNKSVTRNLNINLNKRPEELSNEMFYKIAVQYEKLSD